MARYASLTAYFFCLLRLNCHQHKPRGNDMNNLNANRFHQEKIELLENPYEYYEGLEDITSAESILTFKHGVAKQAFVNGYRAIFLKTSPLECNLTLLKNNKTICRIHKIPEFGGINYLISQINNLNSENNQYFKISFQSQEIEYPSVEETYIINSNEKDILRIDLPFILKDFEEIAGKIKVKVSSIKDYLIHNNPWIQSG